MTTAKDSVPSSDARKNILGAVLLLLLVLAAYGPALHAGFIWDDDMFITGNDSLLSASGLKLIWTQPSQNPHYYPLLMSLFWIMHHVWGDNPAGYHLVSVLCHAGASILFWFALRALGARGAFLAAILFALHPVHVQSVAWATELKNTLSGLFYIGAILAWAREDRVGLARAYGLSALLFAGALLSKTTTVSLPVAIVLLEAWKQGRIRKKTLVFVIGLFALSMVPGLITLGVERSRNVSYVAGQFSLPEKFIVLGMSVWFYLGKLLWPHPLIMIYPYWQLEPTRWAQYVPLALLVLSFPVLFLARKRIGRAPLLAWSFFVATLAPIPFIDVNFVLQHSFVADHFLYLPSLSLAALAAAGLATLVRRRPPAMQFALAGLLALGLGSLTWRHARHYTDQESLWKHTLEYNPRCSVAYNNMGLLMLQQKRVDEAIEVFRKGIAEEPTMAKFHSDMAIALSDKGEADEAAAEFTNAIKLDPTLYEARLDLASLDIRRGKLDAALAEVRLAAKVRPDAWETHWNLGILLLATGQQADALASFRKAVSLRPQDSTLSSAFGLLLGHGDTGVQILKDLVHDAPAMVMRDKQALQPRLLLARSLAQAGETSSAESLLDEVARQQPKSAEALYQLGAVALEKRAYASAADYFSSALAIEPGSSELMNNLAWLRATAPQDDVRDGKEAVVLAERAVTATRRNDPALLDTLAASYAEKGRFDEAIATALEAIDKARRAGLIQLQRDLETRLALYRSTKPFRDSAE